MRLYHEFIVAEDTSVVKARLIDEATGREVADITGIKPEVERLDWNLLVWAGLYSRIGNLYRSSDTGQKHRPI